ncbi:MAG TPA: serine/threonine-protein kinase, partial [Polyangiaceae bacterium]
MSSDSSSLTTGQKLGRYELLLPIARGGMGQVWVARLRGARGFHKLVAIKTLLCLRGEEERMERMLLEEARIASLIQHSNVAQTLELGEHEGILYLVMEWVEGEPLTAVLAGAEEQGGVPLLVAVNLIGQTLRGLQAAHELSDGNGARLGVVHRDVSPHNILVSYSGVVKIVDFGIAQVMSQQPPSSDPGEVQGKFGYMAPEQILGGTVDQRTDLFAVGVLLYLLTTGHHPYKDHAADGLLHGIVSDLPAIRPSLLKPGYSRTLEAVVMKALDKDRDRRWPSAEEMRLALQRGVPQAFSLGFESQLRLFMGDAVGDRASAKRDALRRAELQADLYLAETVALNEAGPGSGAGSLRAVLIDQACVDVRSPSSRPSRAPTERPLFQAAQKPRAVRWALLVGAAISAAAWVALALRAPSATRDTASSGSGMVDLTPPRAPAVAGSSAAPALPPVASASAAPVA